MMRTRLLAAMGFTALMGLALSGPAFAATAASGYKVTDFATDFPNCCGAFGAGPIGLAFDATNHLYVMDYHNGILYKFGTSGGSATSSIPPAQVNAVPISGNPAGIAFSKDGRLYAALQARGEVVELNPTTGVEIRSVTDNTPGATGIATDPLSGDLFVTLPWAGRLARLTNFSTGSATVTTYANLGFPDGITFAPNGTIYVADQGSAVKIVGTNSSASHTPTHIADVSTIDGIALAAGGSGSSPTAIFGNRNDGKITKVDLTTSSRTQTDIVTGGSRGDFSAVGPDGCLYATQTATVIKVTNADGTCSFAPTVAVPTLRLSPGSQSGHAGSSATITATLTNASPESGHVVTFTVTGANPGVGTATTNSSGTATFTYAGTHTGHDTVSAATTANTQAVTSTNSATVTWTAAVPTPTPTPRALPATGGGPPSAGNEPAEALVLLGIVVSAAAVGRQVRRRAGRDGL